MELYVVDDDVCGVGNENDGVIVVCIAFADSILDRTVAYKYRLIIEYPIHSSITRIHIQPSFRRSHTLSPASTTAYNHTIVQVTI